MKIAVIGLGKIGASICADLKMLSIASEVTGVDNSLESVDYCLSKGLVDKGFQNPGRISGDTDISVLAVPVEQMERVALELFTALEPGAVVTDVGSVKAPVAAGIGRILPRGIHFVPAHPIAGDETCGTRSYKTGIFNGNPVVITPLPGAPAVAVWEGCAQAVGKVEQMWKKMGANILKMSAEEHDRMFAFVSHLPHVCAFSLASVAASADSETVKSFAVSGGGLKDTTRIAASDPLLWAGILVQNSGPVLEAVESFSMTLRETAEAIKAGDTEKLAKILERGREAKLRHMKKT